jgi:hypothetical protein
MKKIFGSVFGVPAPLPTVRIIFHSPFHFLMIGMGNVGAAQAKIYDLSAIFVPILALEAWFTSS